MSSRLPSKEQRRNFLSTTTDMQRLSEYLWTSEKLSKKKGGIYKDIYEEDVDFLVNYNTKIMKGGFFWFFGNDDDGDDVDIHTEACYDKIEKSMKVDTDLICKECTSKEKDVCDKRINELETIRTILLKRTDDGIEVGLKRFVDVILCCQKELFVEQNKMIKDNIVPDIVELITSSGINYKYIRTLYKYLNGITGDKKNSNVINIEFINEYMDISGKSYGEGESFEKSKSDLFEKYSSQDKGVIYCSYIIARIYRKYFDNEKTKEKYFKIKDSVRTKLGIVHG